MGMLCDSTQDAKQKNVWHQYQIVLLLGRIRLETYLLPRLSILDCFGL
jgi:hypothetical protein